MYFVMLMLSYVCGGSGRWSQLQLIPVRPDAARWLRPVRTVLGNGRAESGHMSIRTPIRSPIVCRRLGNRASSGLRFRGGLTDRLGAD